MKKLLRLLNHLMGIRWWYLFYGSYVYADRSSSLIIGQNVRIFRAKIHLSNKAKIEIADNVQISNTILAVSSSAVIIGKNSIFDKGEMPTRCKVIVSNHSTVLFGSHNRIRLQKIWVRFGGHLTLGNYINLNEYSEVRCDESVEIGDYVEISYSVKIWDTNTHEFEPIEQRRERWRKMYLERDVSEKPKTKPVIIGSDSWIGENVTILKGSVIGHSCICGYGALISDKTIPDKTIILNKIELKQIPYNI